MERQLTGIPDLKELMTRIVDAHTEHYKSDLNIDLKILREAAKNGKTKEDRVFYWLCRTCGTWCLNEQCIFLKDTREYMTWMYYSKQENKDILAFAVEVDPMGKQSDILAGRLYELDYDHTQQLVLQHSVASSQTKLIYENGEILEESNKTIKFDDSGDFGKFIRFESVPDDKNALDCILFKQAESRKRMKTMDAEEYLKKISKK